MTTRRRRTRPPRTVDNLEKEWMAKVIQAATYLKWTYYHTHDSRRSVAGFPDLVLLKGPRIVVAELKAHGGRVSKEQKEWLEKWALTPAEVFVWYPDDWDEVIAVLKGEHIAPAQ